MIHKRRTSQTLGHLDLAWWWPSLWKQCAKHPKQPKLIGFGFKSHLLRVRRRRARVASRMTVSIRQTILLACWKSPLYHFQQKFQKELTWLALSSSTLCVHLYVIIIIIVLRSLVSWVRTEEWKAWTGDGRQRCAVEYPPQAHPDDDYVHSDDNEKNDDKNDDRWIRMMMVMAMIMRWLANSDTVQQNIFLQLILVSDQSW